MVDKSPCARPRAALLSRCALAADAANGFQKRGRQGFTPAGTRGVGAGGEERAGRGSAEKQSQRNTNFMVNWAEHLDSQRSGAGLIAQPPHVRRTADHTKGQRSQEQRGNIIRLWDVKDVGLN